MSTYPILQMTNLNNFLFLCVTVSENIYAIFLKVGRREINGILEQDAWSKIALDKYVNEPD